MQMTLEAWKGSKQQKRTDGERIKRVKQRGSFIGVRETWGMRVAYIQQ